MKRLQDVAAAFQNNRTTAFPVAPVVKDNVNLPEHYARFNIEPVHFIAQNKLDWFQGNVVKYVVRHDAKNGIEDLRKAIRYLQMYIKYLEGDANWWKREEA